MSSITYQTIDGIKEPVINPKLVIFDMDGLIFDTERLFMKYLTINNAKYGYTLTEQMYADTLGLAGDTLRSKMEQYYGHDYPLDEISQKTRDDMDLHIKENGIPVKNGINQFLCFLKTRYIRCAVASSSPVRYIKNYISSAKLNEYFEFIVGKDMINNSKPAPDIFLYAASKAGVNPWDCLVLEDSENGIRAAHAANMPVICIPDLKYPCDEVSTLTTLILERADDIIPYMSTHSQH